MKAATLETLQQEGRLAPQQALAVAEAIDVALAEAQFVTVPIMDARFDVMDARMDTKIEALKGGLELKIEALRNGFDKRLASLEIRLILAVVLSSLAVGPLGVKVLDALVHWMG
jgi:hypothetical protein